MAQPNFRTAQLQNYFLAGAGAVIGATSIILKSMLDIDGNALVMATDFGVIGYGTLEPGNGTLEEQISFSGLTNNANGTVTLTGVKTVDFQYPYTETSGLAKTHAGSTTFVISNTSGFYNQFPAKQNDETITGQWTFSTFPITPSNSDASTTVKGVTKLSVAPASASDPIAVGQNDIRVPIGYAVDSVGTDAYAITPAYAIPAYVAGQIFSFKAGTANTGASTLNVSGLGAKTIKKDVSTDLVTGDILLNQIVMVEYDGTNMQLLSVPSGIVSNNTVPIVRTYLLGGSPATWTKPAGLKYVTVQVQAGGGGGGGSTTATRLCNGGGGGGYAYKLIAVGTLGGTETVTTGAGGTAGANTGGTGGTGGSSSFGAHATATGGTGGTEGAAPGAGGIGSSGDLNLTGSAGQGGGANNGGGPVSGAGGNSIMGGGGVGTATGNGSGNTGGVYGGGGSGAYSSGNDTAGGAGADGIVVVIEYYN